jgi:uncharacterized protein
MPQFLFKYYYNYFRSIIVLILILVLWSNISAQKLPDEPTQWVMDYARLLSNNQKQKLNNILCTYEDSTSNQIVVAIFQNAQGYPVEDYSIRLAEKWKVGQQGKDNGIILAVFLDERNI